MSYLTKICKCTMGNNMGSWEAHIAIKEGDPTRLSCLISNNVINPNMRFRGETLLTTAITNNAFNIVKILLSKGADPNMKSKQNGRNETPLITATRLKNFQMVRLLMDNKADMKITNFYGHDAIFQAVIENAFEILKYLLEKMTHGSAAHKTKEVCPFLTALRDSSIFPLKNQCLLLLLRYNYRCKCLLAKSLFINDAEEYGQHKRLYESIITNSDTLSWLYLSHCSRIHYMCRFKHTEITFSITGPMKLANLARIAIRECVSRAAMERKSNFASFVNKLPLPSTTLEFLLLKDVSKIINFHYKGSSPTYGDNGIMYNYYCFIL